MKKYKIQDIQNVLQAQPWSCIVSGATFVAVRLIYWIANHTKITPNQITFLNFVLTISVGISFATGHFIVGALFYWLCFVFDIVDGGLARVTGKTSRIGDFYDAFNDGFKIFVSIISLVYGYVFVLHYQVNFLLLFNVALFLFFNLFATSNWLILTKNVLMNKKREEDKKVNDTMIDNANGLLNKYFKFCFKLKIKPMYMSGDVNMLLFIIGAVFFMEQLINFLFLVNFLLLIYFVAETYVIYNTFRKMG